MWPFRKKEERATISLDELFEDVEITKSMALEVPTFSGGIDLIANVIASTPIKLYRQEIEKKTLEDGTVSESFKTIEVKNDYRLKLLNEETGDTLNSNEFWKAIIHDYYTGKGGYAYLNKSAGEIKSIHYVNEENVAIIESVDPIFKNFEILVNGNTYYDFEFLKVLRKTKNGAYGTSLIKENQYLLLVGYYSLRLEKSAFKRGGKKQGFLKSETKLDEKALQILKDGFEKLYNADGSFVTLNKGIDFQDIATTQAEMQLNQNKVTNSNEFSKLFHTSPDLIMGKTSDTKALAKLAAIPLMATIQSSLNSVMLLEKEKEKYYFAFDTKELLKGERAERYSAYKTALDANFMQIDEVRYEEDLPELGLNWIKLGLQDVLYDPATKKIYTPNTGKTAELSEKSLSENTDSDIIEERANPYRQKGGRFGNAPAGVPRNQSLLGYEAPKGTKYAPSKQRNKSKIQVSPNEYSKLTGIVNTNFPNLKPSDGIKVVYSSNSSYTVKSDGYGGLIIENKHNL